jgi:hypothetical protein
MSDVEIEFQREVARETNLHSNRLRISYSAILLAALVAGLMVYKGISRVKFDMEDYALCALALMSSDSTVAPTFFATTVTEG